MSHRDLKMGGINLNYHPPSGTPPTTHGTPIEVFPLVPHNPNNVVGRFYGRWGGYWWHRTGAQTQGTSISCFTCVNIVVEFAHWCINRVFTALERCHFFQTLTKVHPTTQRIDCCARGGVSNAPKKVLWTIGSCQNTNWRRQKLNRKQPKT